MKKTISEQLNQLKKQPKIWASALAIGSLAIGFAGGMGVSSYANRNNNTTFADRMQEQGFSNPDQQMNNQGGQMTPPNMKGGPNQGQTPPDMQNNQESSGQTSEKSNSTTPPSQAKSKNQETKENQETENSFATESN